MRHWIKVYLYERKTELSGLGGFNDENDKMFIYLVSIAFTFFSSFRQNKMTKWYTSVQGKQ